MNNILEHCGEVFINTYRDLLTKNNINASGNLSNSLDINITNQNGDYSVWLYIADYYTYIENGRLPGKQPPVDQIYKWLKNKHLPEERNLSWAIAKSIAKQGVPGKHIFEESLLVTEQMLDKQLNEQQWQII